MKRFFCFGSACLLLLPFVQTQKVGLVLSGGGAERHDPYRYHSRFGGKQYSYRLHYGYFYGSYHRFTLCYGVLSRWYGGFIAFRRLQTLVFRTGRTRIRILFQTEPADPGVFNIRFSFKDFTAYQTSDTSYKHGKSHSDESGVCGAICTGYGCMQRRF